MAQMSAVSVYPAVTGLVIDDQAVIDILGRDIASLYKVAVMCGHRLTLDDEPRLRSKLRGRITRELISKVFGVPGFVTGGWLRNYERVASLEPLNMHPDMGPALRAFMDMGLSMVMASCYQLSELAPTLDHHGIRTAFDSVVYLPGGPSIESRRDGLEAAVESLAKGQIRRRSVAVIATTLESMLAARYAGLRVVLLLSGQEAHGGSNLPQENVRPSLAFVPSWLKRENAMARSVA